MAIELNEYLMEIDLSDIKINILNLSLWWGIYWRTQKRVGGYCKKIRNNQFALNVQMVVHIERFRRSDFHYFL